MTASSVRSSCQEAFPRIVSLIGMPGGGKTTVGRLLARQLGWRFVDSDAEIEVRLHCSIQSYFASHGEVAFRDVESDTLAEYLSSTQVSAGMVLSTGGGIVVRRVNRELLRNRSTAIYLHSTPDELYRRLRHDTQRPLLQVADPLAKLRELYAQRDPLYREVAHYVIETGRPSVTTLVNMVLMQLELAGVAGRGGRLPLSDV